MRSLLVEKVEDRDFIDRRGRRLLRDVSVLWSWFEAGRCGAVQWKCAFM